jgi:sterol 3beta-glucosyltransferase
MTEIVIVASGTRGDVQPYIALGQGLSQAGYRVRLLTSHNFESLVTEAGLHFSSMGPSAEDILNSEEWQKLTESGNFLRILKKMRAEMKQRAAEFAGQLPPLLERSDLMITGMAGMGGSFTVAGMLNIPVIQAYVVPFTPTRAFPSPLVPALPLGAALNRLSFHITRQMFWQSTRAGDAATREVLGLGKAPFWGPYRSLVWERIPALYGYSRHVLPQPADWPQNHVVTGYWFLDAAEGWTPPADLLAFLNAGEPPVYIGFGSMRTQNPEQVGRIALEALERSGQRGVIATGWGGLIPSNIPDTVHLISSMPHGWLLPRMAAVVHHGGAGTTAAGLRSGVPSIVIPFMGDQPFWGRRVYDLGVGPQPIPRKKLTAQRLADAISLAVTDRKMQQTARDLGEKIRAEDGIGMAVTLVEQVLEQKQPADRKTRIRSV